MDGGALVSTDNRFALWRRAGDLQLMRSLGLRPRVTVLRYGVTIAGPEQVEFWTPFTPWAGVDYFDTPLSLDSFEATAEGYALDVTCPCGEPLSADDVGELLREVYKHCGAAKHPLPKFER